MNVEVFYQINFLNSNYIKGKISARIGEDIRSIKKRIA